MEATMLTVDRLVDGINGEDPAGARLYMSQLRENETLLMLECFEDMLSGKLPVVPPSSFSGNPAPLSGSRGGSMAYRVPPNEFLKVLLEGNTTRLGGLHAVLQAIGRGDLQGRAASLCISEVRMCLSACADGSSGSGYEGRRSTSTVHRRMPLAQLRELAGVCVSFSMDVPAVARAPSGRPAAGVYAGGRRGAEDANNRRVLMLEALPVVLGACCAVAAAEEEEEGGEDSDDDADDDDDDPTDHISESDIDQGEEDADDPMVGKGSRGRGARAPVASTVAGRKGKGKGMEGGNTDTRRWRRHSGRAVGSIQEGARPTPRSKVTACGGGGGGSGWSPGGLPERGEAILRDVTDALLDRPWPLRLVLPLLVAFEEIYGLVEMLDWRAGQPVMEIARGGTAGKQSVWARVRLRLMETIRAGGLDGADFTGVVRQVCVLCDTDGRRNYESDAQYSVPGLGQELPDGSVAVRAANVHQAEEGALLGDEQAKEGEDAEKSLTEKHGVHVEGNASGSGSWLSCLRQLYAAVPPEWVSTVELVLEQTLHQMPGVAESLLDAIQGASSSSSITTSKGGIGETDRSGSSGGNTVSPGEKRSACSPTSVGNDLALLLLLLREASPLRACSLPLLPVGVDRGRRAEEGIRRILLGASRWDSEGVTASGGGKDQTPRCRGRGGGLDYARALLGEVLCAERGVIGDAGTRGVEYSGQGGGGSCSSGRVVTGGGGESSGVVSERASQLLELALRWLEEGDGGEGVGGDGRAACGKDGGGAEVSIRDVASEVVSAVFDAVVEARPRLLRALLGGVFDGNQRGTACAWSYMRAWEALMAQEAELEASALISLCRKCSVQGESKGRLLTLQAVTCILAWNARRGKNGRGGGCLDQEGMQEDLVGMFRRAFESGLQTAARADALHLLATKLATSSLEDADQSTAFAGATAVASGTQPGGELLRAVPPLLSFPTPPPRAALGREPPSTVDLSALSDLREFLTARLLRIFAHKDEVLDAGTSTAGGNDGGNPHRLGRHGGGKGKQRAGRRKGGRFQLVPLRLLEERSVPSMGHSFGGNHGGGKGHGVVRIARGRGVVARDPIGHLLQCCWALVPAIEGSTEGVPGDEAHRTVVPGPGKREEAEAIARAVLGAGRRRSGEGGRPAKSGAEVRTREAEALVAVVDFLQRGGVMETLRVVAPSNQGATCSREANGDVSELPSPPPLTCHPGVVSPLTALGIVVTLSEALVDCLLSGSACPPGIRVPPRSPPRCDDDDDGHRYHRSAPSGDPKARNCPSLVLWAVADVFTLLAAATRIADNIAGPAGGFSKHSKARAPESLSEIIVSLPAETLALSRGSELNSAAGAGADKDDEDEGGETTGRGCGKSRGQGGREGGGRGGGGGGGDPMGQCALLSPASALVFVNEFLEWAASETGKSPAALVAQGWDGGIGVWLGLIHSVQTLVRALRNATGESVGMRREGTGGVSSKGKATTGDGPSAEAIALVIFQLRTAVGTPSAALDVLDPSAAGVEPLLSHDEQTTGASSLSPADGGSFAGNTTSGAQDSDPPDVRRLSRRPQPGKMITGFLKRMSERWKMALPWGLPSAAPPRRASPRLERRSGRRRGGGGGFGGENAPKTLKTEAEDLFFALRGELLRAERLVLSILLVGPSATLTSRAWTMRAALASALRRSGEEAVDAVGLGALRPPAVASVQIGAPPVRANGPTEVSRRPSPTGEEPPESGSGPARAAPNANGRNAGPVVLKVTRRTGGGGGCAAVAEQPSGGETAGRGARGSFAGDGKGLYWDGLGSLCRLAATEMREGLEDGLSVKLSQAYLDLIELLGNAALQHQHQARPTPTTTSECGPVAGRATAPRLRAEKESRQASAGSCSTGSASVIANGDRLKEDDAGAGGVLLSIVTCHTIAQPSLFKRLICGGVRFDGVGVIRHFKASRTAAVTLAMLEARDHELARAVVGHGSRKVMNSVEPCPGRSNDANGAKESDLLRRAMPPSPPPSLERSSRLVVHCVRWIRARHGSRRVRATIHLFEEDGCESSEELDVEASGGPNVEETRTDGYGDGEGEDGGLLERESDGPLSRYSFRPEEVKFASSRECFVAMRAALVECEAALSSASGGVDVRGGGGRSVADGDLADVVATVSFGLREFFAPVVVTAAQATNRTATRQKEKQKEAAADSAPVAATVAGPLSTPAPAEHVGEHKSGDCKIKGTTGGACPLAALGIFPDTVKLLLMRVLERLYLVGRGLTVTASSALAKPSSVAIATIGKAQAASSPPTAGASPPPPLPPSGPSPPPSKRRRRQFVTANAGKPGDQAGGAPAKAPTEEGEESAAGRRCGDVCFAAGRAIPAAADRPASRLRSKSVSSSSARQGKGPLQGDLNNGADASSSGVSEPSTSGSATRVPKIPQGPVNPLLTPLLPAAALASGDGLHLMLAARIWAEALRSRTPRGSDDPCRKRASTMLFKMERCELEIGTAAQRARHFLEHFEDRAKHSTVGAGTRDGRVGSAKKRARGRVGNGGGGGGGGCRQETAKGAESPQSGKCDETLENALRLLLSGADTLAAWRRDYAAKEKSRAARFNHDGKSKRGHARRGVAAAAAKADDAEEEAVTGRRGNGARDRFGVASGKRRRSRGVRVRSRNAVIDGWLQEGGEEGGSREDAFVDLEDFIEA
eukprot:g12569.t1